MTKKPKEPKPPEDDPAQSDRFREAARDIEAAGGLSPTGADSLLRNFFSKGKVEKSGE